MHRQTIDDYVSEKMQTLPDWARVQKKCLFRSPHYHFQAWIASEGDQPAARQMLPLDQHLGVAS